MLYRVIIRQYDTFPGHQHESWKVFNEIVEADHQEQIYDALGFVPDEDHKVIVKELVPMDLDSVVTEVRNAL